MLQVWKTQPDLDPAEQAKQLITEIKAFDADGEGDSIIIASGGDGTVGAVASALQGSDIPSGDHSSRHRQCVLRGSRHSHWGESRLHQPAAGQPSPG